MRPAPAGNWPATQSGTPASKTRGSPGLGTQRRRDRALGGSQNTDDSDPSLGMGSQVAVETLLVERGFKVATTGVTVHVDKPGQQPSPIDDRLSTGNRRVAQALTGDPEIHQVPALGGQYPGCAVPPGQCIPPPSPLSRGLKPLPTGRSDDRTQPGGRKPGGGHRPGRQDLRHRRLQRQLLPQHRGGLHPGHQQLDGGGPHAHRPLRPGGGHRPGRQDLRHRRLQRQRLPRHRGGLHPGHQQLGGGGPDAHRP